ncbi:hypothetical protein B0T20DRAFT_122407 [Sordaria brevicollis]|uniref:Uncharacterized protein n=1 Tax=Sordaria brevicollis TaxID=83679 RepID=A0AAE0PL08_SORBR|nr:hypothetical protein B0T20DRAFT_122407 [Sordaria brevicollis]
MRLHPVAKRLKFPGKACVFMPPRRSICSQNLEAAVSGPEDQNGKVTGDGVTPSDSSGNASRRMYPEQVPALYPRRLILVKSTCLRNSVRDHQMRTTTTCRATCGMCLPEDQFRGAQLQIFDIMMRQHDSVWKPCLAVSKRLPQRGMASGIMISRRLAQGSDSPSWPLQVSTTLPNWSMMQNKQDLVVVPTSPRSSCTSYNQLGHRSPSWDTAGRRFWTSFGEHGRRIGADVA